MRFQQQPSKQYVCRKKKKEKKNVCHFRNNIPLAQAGDDVSVNVDST